MLRAIQQFFETHIAHDVGAGDEPSEHAYQLATAALLIEISRADFEVREVERDAITDAIQRAFGLPQEETEELIGLANLEVKEASSLHEFTSLIHGQFTPEQKNHIVELLWQVAFADGEIDKYEEHLVRKIADLIYVPHRDFMQAKHRAQSRMDDSD